MWESLCECPYDYQNKRGKNKINVGNICKCPWIWVTYGTNLGRPMWKTNVNAHMGSIWEQPGHTHVGNICKCPYEYQKGATWANPHVKHKQMPIWVKYGNKLGRLMWETYQIALGKTHVGNIRAPMGILWKTHVGNIRAPMGILWDQPGQTHVGNMCKCPYAYIMGTTWANPCGKHM